MNRNFEQWLREQEYARHYTWDSRSSLKIEWIIHFVLADQIRKKWGGVEVFERSHKQIK